MFHVKPDPHRLFLLLKIGVIYVIIDIDSNIIIKNRRKIIWVKAIQNSIQFM